MVLLAIWRLFRPFLGVEKRAKPDLLLRSTSDDGRPYNDQEDQPETLIELYERQQHMKQIDGIDRISKYSRRRWVDWSSGRSR